MRLEKEELPSKFLGKKNIIHYMELVTPGQVSVMQGSITSVCGAVPYPLPTGPASAAAEGLCPRAETCVTSTNASD